MALKPTLTKANNFHINQGRNFASGNAILQLTAIIEISGIAIMTNHIQTSTQGHVRLITINKPERKNALSHSMYSALADAMLVANSDISVRAIVLTGTPDCFTSGNDVGDFLNNPPAGDNPPVLQFMMALLDCPKPVIAAINGPAVGIGATLLLHCDMVYAGPKTRLQTPFVALGLCPEYGSSLLLPQLVGHHKAFEMLVMGDAVEAEEACRLGIINAVSDDYLEVAMKRAAYAGALPPASVREGKSLMHSANREQIRAQIKTEIRVLLERMTSGEAKEAFSAFIEKRKPDFSNFS